MMLHNLSTYFSEHSLPLIIDATIKASLILFLAIVLDRMLARSSAAVRHRVWGLSLWSALLVPILSMVLPQWQIPILPQRDVSRSLATPVEAIVPTLNSESIRLSQETGLPIDSYNAKDFSSPPFDRNFLPDAMPPTEQPMLVETTPLNANDNATTPTSELGSPKQAWMRFDLGLGLVVIWFVGFLWKLAPILAGFVANQRLIRKSEEVLDGRERVLVGTLASRLGLNRRVPLFEADASVVPMTLGVVRPVIVVPRDWVGWTAEQRECVLLHELAHIKRFDVAYQLVGCFAAAVHWMNPLVWYALRQLRIERELACDDCVLEAGELPSEYAKQLVVVARAYQPYRPSVSVAMASSARLDDRIRAILDTARSRLPLSNKTALALAITASLFVASIVIVRPVARQADADEPAVTVETSDTRVEEASGPADVSLNLDKGIIVKGMVLKPDGSPAVGATIRSIPGVYQPVPELAPFGGESSIGEATVDERGEFEIQVNQRPYGERLPVDDQSWKQFTTISASSDGFGPAWIDFASVDPSKPIRLQLVEDMPIRGRVVDLEGRPLANTQIQVATIRGGKNNDLSTWLKAVEAGGDAQTLSQYLVNRVHPRELRIGRELTTDNDGAFELRGIGRDRVVELTFHSDRVAYEFIAVVTQARPASQIQTWYGSEEKQPLCGATFTFTASPSRPITGIVIDAATKQPIADVSVGSYWFANDPFVGNSALKSTTDKEGRFRLIGYPQKSVTDILVRPNDSQPYFMRQIKAPDPTELTTPQMTIELHRGLWITGRVTDQVTKEPVAGARMYYLPWRTNEFAQALPEFDEDGNVRGDQARYKTDKNGNYRVVGLPGPAIVGAESVLKQYRVGKGYEEVAKSTPIRDKESGWLSTYSNPINPSPKWPDAMLGIHPTADTESIELNFELDPGGKLQIKIVDEKDQPVVGANVLGLSRRGGQFYRNLSGTDNGIFEAICFGSDEVRPIVVLHPDRKIGRATQAGPEQIKQGKMNIKLLPLAEVTGRLMDQGEPLSGLPIELRILPVGDFSPYLKIVTTNQDGSFVCELPTGRAYKLFVQSQAVDIVANVVDELEVQPGQKIELGTLNLGKDRKFVAGRENNKKNMEAASSSSDTRMGSKASPPAERAKSTEVRDEASKVLATSATDRKTITGTIRRKVDGQPATGADLAIIAVRIEKGSWTKSEVFSETVANEDGRFELSFDGDRTSKTHAEARLIARADGYGMVWENLNLDGANTSFDLTLEPEQRIQVRLIDLEGKPASNASIDLGCVMKTMVPESQSPHSERTGFHEFASKPNAWPKSLSTNNEGILTVLGISKFCGVYLKVKADDRFAPQHLALNCGWKEERGENDRTYRSIVKNFPADEIPTLPLPPALVFEGRVLLGETNEPAANSRISIWASQQEFLGSMYSYDSQTDENGRFRLTPSPGVRFGIIAHPPKASGYSIRRLNDLKWESGAGSKNIEIRLPAGVLAHGNIFDASTGTPVVNASVQYIPERFKNPNVTDETVTGWQGIQTTNAAGEFSISVLPGPGTLLVHVNGSHYLLHEMTSRELDGYKPGGIRNYAHAFAKIDPQIGNPLDNLKIELQAGGTVRAKIVDGSGRPVDQAVALTRLKVYPTSPRWRSNPQEVIEGNLGVSGLGANEKYPLFILDAKNKLGATAFLQISDPEPTIMLKPCGTAKVRFVNSDGTVRTDMGFDFSLVVTPGASRFDFDAEKNGEKSADEDFVANIDRAGTELSQKNNVTGEIVYENLIPGATYRFSKLANGKVTENIDFVAKPGETIDLHDIELPSDK